MLLVTINEYKYFQKILREKSQNQINYVILCPWSWNELERNSSKAEVHYNCNEVKLTDYSHLLFRNLTGTVYLPGKFGVRIEDTAIFLEDGVEILTKSPKELIIV